MNDKKRRSWPVRIGTTFEWLVVQGGAGFAVFCSGAIVIMMLVGGADVIGIKLFNTPVPMTLELTEMLMVALVFSGLAYAQSQKRHVRVEIIMRRLTPRAQAALELLAVLIGTIFFSLMTWRCALYFWSSWLFKETDTGLYHFPIYPSKFLMLVGSFLMTLQLLIDIVHIVRNLWGGAALQPKA